MPKCVKRHCTWLIIIGRIETELTHQNADCLCHCRFSEIPEILEEIGGGDDQTVCDDVYTDIDSDADDIADDTSVYEEAEVLKKNIFFNINDCWKIQFIGKVHAKYTDDQNFL